MVTPPRNPEDERSEPPGSETTMGEHTDREHYIPIGKRDLVDLLSGDAGLDPAAQAAFRRLADMLTAAFHFEYHKLLDDLKEVYAPFDPDRVTAALRPPSAEEKAAKLDALARHFVHLMERANFERLSEDAIRESMKSVSAWGVNMDVDFSVFERLELFVRGDAIGRRYLRRWYRPWRLDAIDLPIYRRLVLFVKLRPSKRLPREIDTNDVFLKVFKDIPKIDLEMLLPGARLRMPGLSRLKLGSSLIGSGGWVGYSVFKQVVSTGLNPYLAVGPLAAVLGYGYKQYFGYQSTKNAFSLRLAQSLYYQTLGNNVGVLSALVDEAEEQECREALLAYYHLWRHAGPGGWPAPQLDAHVEADLERRTGLKIDFEIDDALGKLERLKLVTKQDDRYAAVPIDQALTAMDEAWDNFFKYSQPSRATPSS